MNLRVRLLASALALAGVVTAADPPVPTIARMIDGTIRSIESELVPLVEAMPTDKFGFAPTAGEFKGVRTFAQQAKHVAYVNYEVAAAALGEKNPSTTEANENGPATVRTKEEIVKYLKASFAYAHKAAQSLTAENATQMMASPFGDGKMPKLAAINVVPWHSFDHYGQMVVYARMNGIIPPASRR